MSGGGQGSGFSPSGNFGSPMNYGSSTPNFFPSQSSGQYGYGPQSYPNRFSAFGAPSSGAVMDAGMPRPFGAPSMGAPGMGSPGSSGAISDPMSGFTMNGGGNGPAFNPSGMTQMTDNGMSGAPQSPSSPGSGATSVNLFNQPQTSSQGMYQPQGNGAPQGYTYDQNGSLISNALAAQAGVAQNFGGAPQQQQQPQPQDKGLTLSEGPKLGNFGQNTGQSWLYGPTAGMFGAARPPGTPNSYWFNQNQGQWGPLTSQVQR